jgi:hypothetical protein
MGRWSLSITKVKYMNRKSLKKIIFSIIFFIILVSMVQMPVQAQTPKTEKVLEFLRDIVGINVAKYEVTLLSSTVQDYTNEDNLIGDLGYIETFGMYNLVYWDTITETYSDLKVMFSFANTTLRLCSIDVVSGETCYNKALPSNILEATKVLLERYKTSSGDTELTSMSNMLTTVDVTKNSTKIEGNFKLEVSVTSNTTSLSWFQSHNGVDYGSLTLEFEHDSFLSFFDSRSYCKVGSAEVNVSKEQAIDIALEKVKGFSYTYKGKLVENLTIVETQIRTELKANVKDVPTLFYPCWIVDLPLDAVYPGSVYYLEVKIWADTGQIISCKTMGYGGPYPDGSSSGDTSATITVSAPIENGVLPLSASVIAIIIAAVLIPSAIAIAVVTKKKKK